MTFRPLLGLIVFAASLVVASAQSTLVFTPPGAPATAKHVVLLSGDEEYRSEEALPMLAKILSQRHGFKCTVLFALDPDGTINPDNQKSLPGAEALDSADIIITSLRFRNWPDAQMKHFVDAYLRGVPLIGLRTSTHAFRIPEGTYKDYTDFGKKVLGEQWINHWGRHKVEATRAVIEPGAATEAVMRGVTEVFGTSDVYEVYPPADAKILLRGLVLKGMNPTDAPADYKKRRATDRQEQGINEPAMAIAWTRLHKNEAGKENRVLTTTMGAATDFENESLRRLIVNGVYWGLGREVPALADVRFVDPYTPKMYGFREYRYKLKPANYALGQITPAGEPMPPPPPRAAPAQKQGAAAPAAAPGTPPAPAQVRPDGAPTPAAAPRPTSAVPFSLSPGEHVAIVGNALGDRMQHHGWLETMIHAQYPAHRLVVRNLAVTGDELTIRPRSQNFGTPDEWLTRIGAGVVFAYFGFNESFKGPEGLAKFKADLDQFLRETRAKNYNGIGAPRIVLFSPIANEKHPDPNFAVPAENNANLELYTKAMAEVAADRAGVTFVDLFSVSQQLYADAARQGQPPLTINGLHLSEAGEGKLSEKIFPALFGANAPTINEKLRAAINEKNAMWHSRFRTVDGYNVYGVRSQLQFPAGRDEQGAELPRLTNFKVMQEEMSQRDTMTANRDQRVWAVAQGGDLVVKDDNLPPVTAVPTNRPGTNPDRSHEYLSGEEAIAKMKPHAGLKVNLFASEEQFPLLAKPVQMAWDTRGRLWVAVWPSYPERTPDSKTGDSLLVLEDTDGDGKADKCTPFISDLNCPTGFQFYKDGVLVVQAPDIWFIRDTDGDGKADKKERVLMGLDSADSHHTTNSVVYEPGGAIYLSDGDFHRTQVETAYGPVRNLNAGIHRYEPRTGKFEVYASYGFANPHGRTFDRWGNDLITDATGNYTYFGAAMSGFIDYPAKHPRLRTIWQRPSRPSASSTIITSRHLPEEFWGNFLNGNVIGFQGYYRVKLGDDGSGIKGDREADFLSSSDPNFRPVAQAVGPDGAVYFADWANAIIGHMQHHIRDPNRDHVHGRIYRVTAEGRPLVQQPKIYGQPIPALLDLLKAPENHVRELAKIELDTHPSATVVAAVKTWVAGLNPQDADYAHHLTEALWVHQWHNVVDLPLLERVLRSPDANARAAATRVLCYWRDRVPNALALLLGLASDENPRVRLHAVRAASFFRSPAAVDVALAATKLPLDYYLDYVLDETIKQLRPFWSGMLADKGSVLAGDPAHIRFLLRSVTTPELLKLPKTPDVLEQIARQPGVADAARLEAINTIAATRRISTAEVLVGLLEKSGTSDAQSLGKLLVARPAPEFKPLRERLVRLARESGDVQPFAWAAVITSDGSFDGVWPDAEKSVMSIGPVLTSIPLISDPTLRATAYPRLVPLMERPPVLPDAIAPSASTQRSAIRAAVSTRQEPAAQFKIYSQLIQRGEEVPIAAQAMRSLPRANWDAADLKPTVTALVDWAKKTPVNNRRTPDYLGAIQATEDLVGLLPTEEAAPFLQELRGLRVPLFLVRAVPEQMRFDTTRIVVEAGRAFQIIFENPDVMPHNLVIVKPGSRERVGTAAMTLSPEQLDSRERAFVPNLADVVNATKTLEPGQNETLRVSAIETEGVYEYVCTFPGHWLVMWGQLVVTKDPAAYVEQQRTVSAPAVPGPGAAAHAHTTH